MESLAISVVGCTNGKRLAIISELKGDLGIDVKLTNGGTIYKSGNMINYESRPPVRSREVRETYLQSLQESFQPVRFTAATGPRSTFSYDFSMTEDQLTFTIKQQLPGESHFLLFFKGEFKSSEDSAQDMLSLLEDVNGVLAAKDEEVNYIREDSQYFKDSIDTLQSDRDNFSVWKENLQDKLIQGFCCVLNSKKREIARLQNELDTFRREKGSSKTSNRRLETIAEKDADTGDDASSVASSVASTTGRRKVNTRKRDTASTRKKTESIKEEEEDEEEEGEEELPWARKSRAARGVALAGTRSAKPAKSVVTRKKIKNENEEQEDADFGNDRVHINDADGVLTNKYSKIIAPSIVEDDDATGDELDIISPQTHKWSHSYVTTDSSASGTVKTIVLEPNVASSYSNSQSYSSIPPATNSLLLGGVEDDSDQSDRDLLAEDHEEEMAGSQNLPGRTHSFPVKNVPSSANASAVASENITSFLESQQQQQHQVSRKRNADLADITHYDERNAELPPISVLVNAVSASSATATASITSQVSLQVRKKSKASKFLAEADSDDD